MAGISPMKSLGVTGTRYTIISTVPLSVLHPIVPVFGILPVLVDGTCRHYRKTTTESELTILVQLIFEELEQLRPEYGYENENARHIAARVCLVGYILWGTWVTNQVMADIPGYCSSYPGTCSGTP